MLRLAMALVLILTVGCSSEEQPDAGQNPPGTKSPKVPGSSKAPSWGELPCQVEKSCNHPALNLEKDEIEFFLESQFSIQYEISDDSSKAIFLCGARVQREWVENFIELQGLNLAETAQLSQFSSSLIEAQSCLIKSDYKSRMLTFFKNTKEYQNATK